MYLLQADTIRETGNIIRAFSGLDLIIVAVLIIAVLLIWKFLPKWVDKKSEVRMLEINKQNEQMEMETNALVKGTSNRLEKLEVVLTEINNNSVIKRIDKIDKKVDSIIEDRIIQENKLNDLTKQVLRDIIYNENIPVLERLEAFNEYIKLGGNGNCKEFAMKLILKNQELWKSILSKESIEIQNLETYYKDQLKEISRSVLH